MAMATLALNDLKDGLRLLNLIVKRIGQIRNWELGTYIKVCSESNCKSYLQNECKKCNTVL